MTTLPKRKEIRLKNYDYSSNGYYFVTICSFDKKRNIEKYKDIINRTLVSLPDRFAGVFIDYSILMPTHLYVIFVFDGVKVKC